MKRATVDEEQWEDYEIYRHEEQLAIGYLKSPLTNIGLIPAYSGFHLSRNEVSGLCNEQSDQLFIEGFHHEDWKKGKAVILIECRPYEKEVRPFLETSGAIEVAKSKFNAKDRKVKKAINAVNCILPRSKDKKFSLVQNQRIARLHKSGTPVRSVISTISAPTYCLAAFFND